MSERFFSVIVPMHNSAEYCRRGLRSIREQTFRDYELICVCDECTDNTRDIAEEYADKVVTTHHGMDGLARNAGIDVANGQWLLFMDDDDWWIHSCAFEDIALVAADCLEDLILFDFIWQKRRHGRDEHFRQKASYMNIAVWSKCFRRSLIGDTRFPAIPFTSDKPFMEEIVAKEPRIHAMGQVLYYYNYMRPGSQTWEDQQK